MSHLMRKRCEVWNPSNAHVQPLKRVRDVALCLKLPLTPFIVWANSEGSVETAWMRRLAWAFAVCLCDKYLFFMCRLKSFLLFEKKMFYFRFSQEEKGCTTGIRFCSSSFYCSWLAADIRQEKQMTKFWTGKRLFLVFDVIKSIFFCRLYGFN